jgi:hypothetical protein
VLNVKNHCFRKRVDTFKDITSMRVPSFVPAVTCYHIETEVNKGIMGKKCFL